MMKYVKNILGYLLGGICFVSLTWSYACFKRGENSMGLISAAVAFVPVLWLLFGLKRGVNRQKRAFEEWKDKLKATGVAIGVDYGSCEIAERKQTINYTRRDVPERSFDTKLYRPDTLQEEPGIPEPGPWSREGSKVLDEKLFPDIMNQQYSYDHCVCIILYTTEFMGQEVTFVSEPVLMDRSSLGVQLALEKKGIIYVNPDNPEEYFWDIGFLFL